MPGMTRTHMNQIADATNAIIALAKYMIPDEALKAERFAAVASSTMADALVGTSSTFNADRFRERCLGINKGR